MTRRRQRLPGALLTTSTAGPRWNIGGTVAEPSGKPVIPQICDLRFQRCRRAEAFKLRLAHRIMGCENQGRLELKDSHRARSTGLSRTQPGSNGQPPSPTAGWDSPLPGRRALGGFGSRLDEPSSNWPNVGCKGTRHSTGVPLPGRRRRWSVKAGRRPPVGLGLYGPASSKTPWTQSHPQVAHGRRSLD